MNLIKKYLFILIALSYPFILFNFIHPFGELVGLILIALSSMIFERKKRYLIASIIVLTIIIHFLIHPFANMLWAFIGLILYLSIIMGIEVNTKKEEKLKELFNELKQSKQKYENLFNNVNDAIYLHAPGLDNNFVEVNDRACSMLGYSREELLNMTPVDINDLSAYNQYFNQERENTQREIYEKGHLTFNMVHRTRDGNTIPVELSSHFFLLDGEEVVLTIARDISKRLKIEENMRIKDYAINSSINGIAIVDLNGKLLDVNNSFLVMWGYSEKKEVLGKHIISMWKDSRQADNVLQTVYEKGYWMGDMIARKNNDKFLHVHLSASLIKDKSGNPISIMTSFMDISDLIQAKHRITFLNFHDNLTGLYNRQFFEEEVKRLNTKRKLPLSIIIGDVNNMKLVNDTFGHLEGDSLLIKVAEIMKRACRSEDIIARWGGDEFIILLPETTNIEAEKVVKRIYNGCIKSKGDIITPSIALGSATKLKMETDINDIFKMADDSMYRNKLLREDSIRSTLISSLVETLAEKSDETAEHNLRMQEISQGFADYIGLSSSEKDKLLLLSKLHDIGKIGIPDKILFKPLSLTEEEWKIIKTHPEIGYRIAQTSKNLTPISEGILSHHERWDGKGYPHGLKGEEIPLIARIVSIVDTFDVMTWGRIYRQPVSIPESIKEIERCSGSQFDPDLVEKFVNYAKASLMKNKEIV